MTFSTIDFANDVLDVLSEEWPDHVDMLVRVDPRSGWDPPAIVVSFRALITPSHKTFSSTFTIVRVGGPHRRICNADNYARMITIRTRASEARGDGP